MASRCHRDASERNTRRKQRLQLCDDSYRRVKYVWAVPLKSKSESEVAAALSKIFRDDVRHPRNLQTDKGSSDKEFYNASVKAVTDRYDTSLLDVLVMKAAVVE
ncbi:hypothetical protein P5V15_002897 [Pogonomyrmex californicus]